MVRILIGLIILTVVLVGNASAQTDNWRYAVNIDTGELVAFNLTGETRSLATVTPGAARVLTELSQQRSIVWTASC